MTSSPDILTQCPHCRSQFRVTEKQLTAARGKVRCGHCLQVFNAREHHMPEDTPEEIPEEIADTDDDSQDDEDDLIFDDNPEVDAADGRYAGHKYHSRENDEDELNETLMNMERGVTPDFHDVIDDHDQSRNSGADDSWAEALLADDETPPAAEYPQNSDDVRNRPALKSERTSVSEMQVEGLSEQPERDDPVWANLSSQPVKPPKVDRPSLKRRLLWSTAILAATAMLIYQIGWLHFERLALYEPLRPWYATLCNWTGCELPRLQAVDQINSRELVVRSHPDQDNALLLEVTLVNEAGFDQPYPAIALSFSNLNNDIVAQSVFQPEEYLADEEPANTSIPAGEKRRIRMALRDPGKSAINYRIDLMPSR